MKDPAPSSEPAMFLHYAVQGKIGEGATAEVYRAVDRKLNRPVALKFLKGEVEVREQARKRFMREAQAAARVVHPNVVGVHDVGEAEGRLYLAMELVEGRPLDEMLEKEKPGLRSKVALLEKAARGVAAAHGAGIVHRDLKPGNIMVARDGTPKVADFGLAHLVGDQTKLTRTGAAVGTPLYMAPEQVSGRGGTIEPATDVYALGAILYEILAGKPPHVGMNVTEVYAKIVGTDPEAPRKTNPGVPQELEAVCLKALDKEGRRRYPTAGAFAEELERWLSGEPVQAKRTSRVYRLYRRVKRNPVVAGLGVAASLAAIVAGTFWWAGRQSQAALTREKREALEMMRSTARVSLAAALDMRRAGLNGGMRKFLPELEEAYRRTVARAPELAEVDYLMGRMYRALMEDGRALEYQNRALRKDPDCAPALYERIVLLYREYRSRVQDVVRDEVRFRIRAQAASSQGAFRSEEESGGPSAMDRGSELTTMIRQMETDLGVLSVNSRGLERPQIFCTQGLLAWVRGDMEKAALNLRSSVEHAPQLEEAYEALAALESDHGRHEESIRWFEVGRQQDQGYVGHREGVGYVRLEWGLAKEQGGLDPQPLYEAARAEFESVIALAPGRVQAWLGRGRAHHARALYGAGRGQDAESHFERAGVDFDHAVELAPRLPEAWYGRGTLRDDWAYFRSGRGGEAEALFADGVADLTHALSLDARRAKLWAMRGAARNNWAEHRIRAGGDPGELMRSAIADFGEATALEAGNPGRWTARGVARMNLGHFLARGGHADADLRFDEAIGDFTQAIQHRPDFDRPYVFRAGTLEKIAMLRMRRGQDPRECFERAESDVDAALRINPASGENWQARGQLKANWGGYLHGLGQDPRDAYRQALEAFERALSVNPSNAITREFCGNVRLNLGRFRSSRGERARDDFEGALEAYMKALQLDPRREPSLRASVMECRRRLGIQDDR